MMYYDSLISGYAPLQWLRLADASGSSVAADSSGNGRSGTATNVTFGQASIITSAPANTSASFNGTSSTVLTSYNPSLGATLTIIVWVKVSAGTTSGRLVANSHTDSDNNGFQLLLDNGHFTNSGTPVITLGNGTSYQYSRYTTSLTTGTHMLATTYDGSNILLYVDGSQVDSQAFPGAVTAGSATGIGLGYNPTYSGDYYTGLLAEYALIGSTLPGSNIAALYSAAVSAPVNSGSFFAVF